MKQKRKLVYWCVPCKDSGYNKRFQKRGEAFRFWKSCAKAEYRHPSKVTIEYWSIFDLADNCLSAESTVQEPYFEDDSADWKRQAESVED